MRKRIILLIVFGGGLMVSSDVKSQIADIVVKGVVVDKETNEPLPGVVVFGGQPPKPIAATDDKGRFTATVSRGEELRFRFLGFSEYKVNLKSSDTTLTIRMNKQFNKMDELVVRGYQSRPREISTGSSVIVSGKELQDVPVSNVAQLLQGKVAGLNIQVSTGQPGARAAMTIRGISSLEIRGTGSSTFLQPTSPLIIIDGVPLSAESAAEYGLQMQGPNVSPLSLIPPEDIESIEVLKDAEATSLYGSRGTYGVMIITTKRGHSQVPKVRYTGNFFVSTRPKLRETLGGRLEREIKINEILNNGNIVDLRRLSNSPILVDSLNPYYNNSTDWQAIFYHTTLNETHNLAIDGGDQGFNYKTNIGYYSESGILKNTGFKRFNVNMNMQFNPTRKFRLSGAIFGTLGQQGKGEGNSLLQTGVATSGQASSLLPPPAFYLATSNILSALRTKNSSYSRNLRANVVISYEPTSGLTLGTNTSYNYASNIENTFTPAVANNQFAKAYSYHSRDYTLYNRSNISYAKTIAKDHNFYANIFDEIYIQGTQAGNIQQQKIPNDQLRGPLGFDASNPSGGGVQSSSYRDARLLSFAGAFSYNYKAKYVIDLTYRLDGTSSSAINAPYSKNPSIGLRWNFNKERWFEKAYWLTYGDIRLTWGRNIVPTATVQNRYGSYGIYANYDNRQTIGINNNVLPNPFLEPTTTTQYNFGFDLGFLGNRLALTFDSYYKQVKNLPFNRTLAGMTGFNVVSTNDAWLIDYGYEFSLIGRLFPSNSKVDLTISLNAALNRDVLTKLPAEYGGQYILPNTGNGQSTIYRVGRNTLSNFLLINQGVYATDADVPIDPLTGLPYRPQNSNAFFQAGDPIIKDMDGNYVLTDKDYGITGNSQPLVVGGFSTNIVYKNFALNVYASFTIKRTLLNNALADRFRLMSDPFGTQAVIPVNDHNVWLKNGDQAKYPYPYDYYRSAIVNPFSYNQTLWQEDGSYLKINSMTLSYLFDTKLIKNWGIHSLRVYISSGNVITFSDYSGPNPENVTNTGRDASGGYPLSRSYTLGLNIELL